MIYYIKMRLFARQLKYSHEETEKLERICRFICLLYVPAWLTAPLAAEAACTDLRLHQTLQRFREVDEVVAEAALNKMRRHTSYLRPETVVFCLASEAVNADHRADIASTLLTRSDDPETEEDADPAASIIDQQTRLPNLVDGRSWLVFKLLGVDPSSWLKQPVDKWKEDA